MKKEIVKFEHVNLYYTKDKPICLGLNFTFFAGEFYFLTGASGAGKTSLLKLIYRELIATEGTIRVFGKNFGQLSPYELPMLRQKMGLVFQDCRLIDSLSVLDNVALPLKISGSDVKKARIHAKELLHWVGLSDQLNSFPSTLSDGQKQRVGIARAVINKPLLLLADEPTGNVDDVTAFKMMNLFEELNKMGTTIIMATHNRQIVTTFPYPELQLYRGQLSHSPYPPQYASGGQYA